MSAGEIIDNIVEAAKQTSWMEYAAVASALLYLVLATFENILCWLFGIISSFIYVYICYQSNLYLETFLQVFYIAMGVYGWYQWEKNKGNKVHAPIIVWPVRNHLITLIAGAALGGILGFVFARYTAAAQPYLDAFITSYSLIATWMTTKKILENWIYWIIIDAASIILYSNRGLYLSGLLFFIYTVLAAAAFIAWSKERKRASIA